MIRPTPLFTIVFCFFVALNTTTNARTLGASAMGADHEDGELASQPAWPAGFHAAVNKKNRIHGYWVNTTDVFFYRGNNGDCLLYTSPSPRDATLSRMPSSA